MADQVAANTAEVEKCRQALIRARTYVDEQHKSQETKMTNMMKLIEKLSKTKTNREFLDLMQKM